MKLSNDVSAALAEDHHVVRYDVRGAGRSDAPARRGGDYRLAQRGRQSSDALRRAAARCGALRRAAALDFPAHPLDGQVRIWDVAYFTTHEGRACQA
ncbi:hypothetical protein [Streptomyces sp. CA-106110]|uniref:hypothetical protein n=1 Tax=Streptomyces sp. CA-106110 TaxID=3240044 RepID=UPI003D8B0A39